MSLSFLAWDSGRRGSECGAQDSSQAKPRPGAHPFPLEKADGIPQVLAHHSTHFIIGTEQYPGGCREG